MTDEAADTGTAENTYLAEVRNVTPITILQNPDDFAVLVGKIEEEVAAFQYDLTTDKGRREVKSLAFKIVKTKTFLDNTGKKLNEEARAKIDAVDESRRAIRDRLDELRDRARKPLDEWDAAEAERIKQVNDGLTALRNIAFVREGATADQVQEQLDNLKGYEIPESIYQGEHARAVDLRAAAIDTLESTVARLRRVEAELAEAERNRAELEQLRAEKAAREKADADKKESDEQAERDRIAEEQRKRDEEAAEQRRADEAERRRIQNIEATINHINQCAKGMIGGQPAAYGILLYELEHKVVIDTSFGDRRAEVLELRDTVMTDLRDAMKEQQEREAERTRQEAATKATRETEARLRKEQEARDAETERKRIADEKKANGQRHQVKIMGQAKTALMEELKLDEDTAMAIVRAIKNDKIKNVTINF